MRCVIARVLPVPAPARMHTGPRTASAAARCSGSRPVRTASAEITPQILPADSDENGSGQGACGQPPRWNALSADVVEPSIGSLEDLMLTMYTTTWCGYCVRLKAGLQGAGIAFDEVNIEQDPQAADYVMSVNGG